MKTKNALLPSLTIHEHEPSTGVQLPEKETLMQESFIEENVIRVYDKVLSSMKLMHG